MESKEIQQRLLENLRKIRKNKKMTQLDLAIDFEKEWKLKFLLRMK